MNKRTKTRIRATALYVILNIAVMTTMSSLFYNRIFNYHEIAYRVWLLIPLVLFVLAMNHLFFMIVDKESYKDLLENTY